MEDFYLAKSLALLHDPPTKAWVIARKEYEPHGRGHEEEAKWFKDQLNLKSTGKLDECVKRADHLASAFDRWLLGMFAGKAIGAFPYLDVVLKNILSPKNNVKPESPKDVEGFVNELARILEKIDDPKLRYHVLYALYEPLFLKYNPKCVGPADTRIPTHSIFDHVYASASIVNWTFPDPENLDGYLVLVDIAGIQEFISSSRKLRDLWISSLLVSVLCWASVSKLIEELGPDILITPSARNNPFYYHLLLTMLSSRKVDSEIINLIESIAEAWAGYNIQQGAPMHPVIPGSIILILPKNEILRSFGFNDVMESIKKEYKQKFKELVDRVYETLKRYFTRQYKDEDYEKAMNLLKYIEGSFKMAEDMGLKYLPPLQLRIVKVSVKEVLNELRTYVKDKLGDEKTLEQDLFSYLIYDFAYHKLWLLLNLTKTLKAEIACLSDLTTWSEKEYKSKKEYENKHSWKYCTTCGKLPAVLDLPREEESYEKLVPEDLRPMFSPGEKLCFYCLLKRICTLSDIFNEFVSVLLDSYRDVKARTFISVSDVALTPFKLQLIDYLKFIQSKRYEDLKKLMEPLGHLIGQTFIRLTRRVKLKDLGIPKLDEELKQLSLDEQDYNTVKWSLYIDSELLFFSEDENVRRDVSKFLKELRNGLRRYCGTDLEFTTYYAIIRADGDNIGKILYGALEDGLDVDFESFLLESITNEELKTVFKKFMNAVRSGGETKLEEVKEIVKRHVKEHEDIIRSRLRIAYNLIRTYLVERNEGRSEERFRILVSPAFHVTISRALMVEAVRDAKIMENYGGLLIYSGGDDILAVLPIKDSLNAVKETRLSFSVGDHNGFYVNFKGNKVDLNAIIPTMGLAGRSYCVLYGHYKHPLSLLLNMSSGLLEDVAKEIKWVYCMQPTFGKDTCVIAYVPRGSKKAEIAVVPLRNAKLDRIDGDLISSVIATITSLSESVYNGEISKRMLYNLLTEDIIWSLAMNLEHLSVSEKLVEYILKRARVSDVTVISSFKDYIRFNAKLELNRDIVNVNSFNKNLLWNITKACNSYLIGRRARI